MAARQRTTMTQSQAADTVYKDFQPKSEWVEEAAANVLTIHLPGFMKDQVKVTYDEKLPKMTIRGERPVSDNVVSRFLMDFTIPDNCKINEMKAKFDQRQVLSITMPKKTITPVIARPSNAAPKDQTSSPMKAATTETKPPPKPQKEKISPLETGTAAATSSAMGKEPERKAEEKVTSPTRSPKAPALTEPKTEKETSSKATGQKQADDKVPQPFNPLGDTSRPRSEEVREETSSKAPLVQDVQKPTDDWKKSEPSVKQVSQKVAEHQELKAMKEKDQNQSQSKESSSQALDRIGKEAGGPAAAAKRAVLGLDEDRRFLLNAGVAVLVIVAVGTYFGYKWGSSGGSHTKS
ncbi:protein RESTRICTED TEV MOVEMENT 2-like isoform X2 [Punica granatum]|uniref:Uncharacterized protein n=3 Tax=Punica granatum TaxID=22663 RepID=A0A2I0GH60_PUNGR|nr:protein RESTRICTED TEV MOVEMENT 2-like isoform X2 [Punica granatum]PKH54259.1 hypothetical protein CRG98_050324 [Punica granatum]